MNQLYIGHFPELEYSAQEAMNTLCTNLSYSGRNLQTILITSRYEREGKSFVSMNLLRTLARLQKKVVLVDADMRRSSVVGWYRVLFEKG